MAALSSQSTPANKSIKVVQHINALKGFRHQLKKKKRRVEQTINSVHKHQDADSYNVLHFQRSTSVIAKISCVHGI